METKNSCIVHVWQNDYNNNDDEVLFIYDDELTVVHDVVVGDKVAYLQANMAELEDSDFYTDDDELKPIEELVEIVDWDAVDESLNIYELSYSELITDDEFTEDFAAENGYSFPSSTENAFVYRGAGSNFNIIFESMCLTTTYTVSEDSVNIDIWDGRNYTTGGTGMHEKIHRVRDEDAYIVVQVSQWQGDTDTVVNIGSLDEIREYLESLGGRDIDEILNELTEL